ncbi:MAG: AAA family ATPase [Sphingobacterium sp.]
MEDTIPSNNSILSNNLDTEIKVFAEGLPYWSKYLAERRLSGNEVLDEDIDKSYGWLLEELGISEKTERPVISIIVGSNKPVNYVEDLNLLCLENVEGVNALKEGQKIDFGKHLTILYGSNGSGKSGYTRLLKQVFYSKSPEEILHNIHIESGHKPVGAKFTFTSSQGDITLMYSDKSNAAFRQFSVFDGKSVIRHLDQKNEFEFRPAGLSFFSEYSSAVLKVEQKLAQDILIRNSGNTSQDLADLFEGNSDIREFVQSITAKTKITDLDKYVPFSPEEEQRLKDLNKAYEELYLASRGKEKEIATLDSIKKLLNDNKVELEKRNRCFTDDYIQKINESINDFLEKEILAKAEGIGKFETSKIVGIGSSQWKDFILAAEGFSQIQATESYPVQGDNCLLCQQPLTDEARLLISNYWLYIKSVAEENVKGARSILTQLESGLLKLNFNLFPSGNTLSAWMEEKYPQILSDLKKSLAEQEKLRDEIVKNIQDRKVQHYTPIEVATSNHPQIEQHIDESIALLRNDEVAKELEKIEAQRTFFTHKERYNNHLSKFKTLLENLIWVSRAGKINFRKVKTEITTTEKTLSEKYFNQKYIDAFNEECRKLNGNFDISISHTAAAGKSYRQLKLKGSNPHAVLSEGEQKVIAVADFLAEMGMSEINRGFIFDDPVTSLDEVRKSEIAKRLAEVSKEKQTIVFTHDLVFVSSLIGHCADISIEHVCHWIENNNGNPGVIWLNNAPSYEKSYRNAKPAKDIYDEAKKSDCPPERREYLLKSGFAALRTCYEVLVIHDLFSGVVQRFNERVSIDSLKSVHFDAELIVELQDSFGKCCRYMEGHAHSDPFAFKRPEVVNLNEEILRYEAIKASIKAKKSSAN